jgi:hypothetical protein
LVVLSCSPTWSLSTAPWVVRRSGWYGSRSFVCWWNSICFSWSQWTFLLSFDCQSPWWDSSVGFDTSGKCQNYPYEIWCLSRHSFFWVPMSTSFNTRLPAG